MDLKDYMELNYTKIIQEINDENGRYFYGKVLELDGCQSDGDTLEEVYNNLNEAMEEYISLKLEMGFNIPLPVDVDSYSGKFVVRIPKTLHQKLSIEAQQEGVSLNQYALYKLSK
ncbi:MAG: toxin-antitoxin system HicB family antitoxin [Eubacteriales bacterium]|nr:toxin-antitoxin system HicB family antitoxin [Eubacteriales bacterium]